MNIAKRTVSALGFRRAGVVHFQSSILSKPKRVVGNSWGIGSVVSLAQQSHSRVAQRNPVSSVLFLVEPLILENVTIYGLITTQICPV